MLCFLPIIMYLGITSTLCYFTKEKFGFVLPVSLVGSGLLMYISQFVFNTFYVGIGALVIIGCAGWILIVLGYLKEKKIQNTFFSNYFTKGLLIYLFICILFIVIDLNRCFQIHDELSHWGLMVKEMLRLDSFYADIESNLIPNRNYPPFVPLIEIIWCFLNGAKYSEDVISMAMHIFELAVFIVPLIEGLSIQSKKKNILGLCFIVLGFVWLIASFDPTLRFKTIYVDFFFPLLFVYCLWLVISKYALKSRFGFISLIIAESGLILVKTITFEFVILVVLEYILFIIFNRNEQFQTIVNKPTHKRKRVVFNSIVKMCLVVGIPIIFYFSWNLYLSSDNVYLGEGMDITQFKISEALDFIKGFGADYQYQVLKAFIIALFEKKIYTGVVGLTYFSVLLFVSLVYVIIYIKSKDKNIVIILIVNALGAVGYAVTILATYLFMLPESDSLKLVMFERFMPSYAVSEVIVLAFVCLNITLERGLHLRKILIAVAIISFVLFDHVSLNTFMPRLVYDNPVVDYEKTAIYIKETIQNKGNRVFILAKSASWNYFVQYYANDLHINGECLDAFAMDLNDIEYLNMLEDNILNYEYVFIKDLNDNVKNFFEEHFLCASEDLNVDTLYKIYDNNGESFIEPILD